MIRNLFISLIVILASASFTFAKFENVPGKAIAHSPASSGKYCGSPSLCVLPDGTYIISHDFFGPKANALDKAVTHIYRSKDKGLNWEKISEINQFWGGLFYHNNALWIMSTNNEYGSCIIRKSTDGGLTWTDPKNQDNGLLIEAEDINKEKRIRLGYHTAPCSIEISDGRIWRAMERVPSNKWGSFAAFVMSAAVDSDLLKASSWTHSNAITFPNELKGFSHWTWLEGNMIKDRKSGEILNIMRVEGSTDCIAAILKVSKDGKILTFNNGSMARLPGATKKFVPRYNEKTKKYYALSNYIPEEYFGKTRVGSTRNTLALIESDNLRTWKVNSIILQSKDVQFEGFQYVDWLFDGDDIIFACRTAFFDGKEKAHNQHDSNFITFHRIPFQALTK